MASKGWGSGVRNDSCGGWLGEEKTLFKLNIVFKKVNVMHANKQRSRKHRNV